MKPHMHRGVARNGYPHQHDFVTCEELEELRGYDAADNHPYQTGRVCPSAGFLATPHQHDTYTDQRDTEDAYGRYVFTYHPADQHGKNEP